MTPSMRTVNQAPPHAHAQAQVGSKVPDFELVDQHGNTVALRDLIELGPVVVYFDPKAMTAG